MGIRDDLQDFAADPAPVPTAPPVSTPEATAAPDVQQPQEQQPPQDSAWQPEAAPQGPTAAERIAAATAEWSEYGDLSDETYQGLADAGYSREVVDAHIEGRQALAARKLAEVHEAAGGADRLGQALEWAKHGLSAAEREAFNSIASSGDIGQIKLAVAGLRAQFEQANGVEPERTLGGTVSASLSGYESDAQMVADIRNPLYRTDPAFRANVEAKARGLINRGGRR